MKLNKHPVTLLEVLIAMVLTVLVLMTLMFFYQQVVVIGSEIDQTKTRDFYTRYVENRLAYALPKTLSAKKSDFVFFSVADEGLTKPGTQSLIFSFDNGVSLDKIFSNHVIARLYLDKEGHLMLAYWPSPKNWDKTTLPPIKKEVLLEDVESMELAYFIAPVPPKKAKSDSTKKDAEATPQGKMPVPKKNDEQEIDKKNKENEPKAPEPEPKGDWRLDPWLKEFQQPPLMVRITLKLKDREDKIVFVFPLVNAKGHIIYD